MHKYLIQRLLSTIPVLIVVSVIIFIIIRMAPGDPAMVILGEDASAETLADLRERMGLNLEPIIQYGRWVSNILRGNLGISTVSRGLPVAELIGNSIRPTLSLTLFSMVISITVSLTLGILSARKHGGALDHGIAAITMFGISVPNFLFGLGLMFVFSVKLRWFPVSGYKDWNAGFAAHFHPLVLPAISLGLMHSALLMRMTRASVLEVLGSDFILLAKAKGVGEFSLLVRHTLRNALLPIITVIGQSFIGALSGAAVIESMFNIPGMGQLIVNSISRRDYLVIQTIVLFITLLNVAISLIVDLLYCVVDPRIRLSH
ncbi:oligopeptide transport system permease protein AppB [Treponema primitia ZAS-2]|uniref:Oligopeptide transport system permease protein AppB n=1 Tax=Treponema primitia (strain ATCC BAA-887 / DSM 12427 / ZAS-2) TaxID=545694 RepID=F5YK15_TREPZ|nr:ABC transporter permease [Treponema primitia]AEF85384.1 oligopeptide transport system permease protein AppB [Treponema primitia ZAS-2]